MESGSLVDDAPCLPVDLPVEWSKVRGKGRFLLWEQGFPLKFVLGPILQGKVDRGFPLAPIWIADGRRPKANPHSK